MIEIIQHEIAGLSSVSALPIKNKRHIQGTETALSWRYILTKAKSYRLGVETEIL